MKRAKASGNHIDEQHDQFGFGQTHFAGHAAADFPVPGQSKGEGELFGGTRVASAEARDLRVPMAGAPAPDADLPVFTFDEIADQLTDGYFESQGGGGGGFAISAGGTLDVNITALADDAKQLAVWALDAWTAASGIVFNYITGSGADIDFDDEDDGAYAATTTTNGVMTHVSVNVSKEWLDIFGTTRDTYSLQTYIHEIGHALGLGHAGNYNGGAVWGVHNHYLNDSWQATVMSYFSQEDNTYIDASYAYVITPMVADIIAIRNLYGTTAINAGSTTYDFETEFGGNNIGLTIVDTGGVDTVDFSWSGSAQRIDLNQEHYSDVGGLVGNLGISRGSVIENAIGGSGLDVIIGNAAANTLTGMSGGDTLTGGGGNDTLVGGEGSDTAVYSGAFANYQIVENSNGTFAITALSGNEGTDTLDGIEKLEFSDLIYTLNLVPTVATPLVDKEVDEAEDFLYVFTATSFSDPEGTTLSYTATLADGSALPDWLSFDAATRRFSGVPGDGDVGTINVKVTASDGEKTTSDTFAITVNDVNQAPDVGLALPDQDFAPGSGFSFTIAEGSFLDADGDTLALVATLGDGSALPSWITFDPATGSFAGSPEAGDIGDYVIRVTASDGSLSISDSFSVSIATPNAAPDAVDDTGTMSETRSALFDVRANDSDADSDSISVILATVLSGNATAVIENGQLRVLYTGTDLGAGQQGEIEIEYRISDGKTTSDATLTVTVNGQVKPGKDIVGDNGVNELDGSDKAERIFGLGASDTIFGNGGKDKIDGGKGNDFLTGGANADTFIFDKKSGVDVIEDFSLFDGDVIDLSAIKAISSFKDLMRNHVDIDGGDTVISLSGRDEIHLDGITSKLTKGDFIL